MTADTVAAEAEYPLITSKVACGILGVNRTTLHRWVKDGKATPALRLPGQTGAYLFTPEEVARLASRAA